MILVFLGLMTGAVVTLIVTKVTHWFELGLLGGWGALFTVAIYNGDLARLFKLIGSTVGLG